MRIRSLSSFHALCARIMPALVFLLGCLFTTALAAAPEEVLLDRGDSESGWQVNLGREFPGAQGTLTLDRSAAQSCLQVAFDFSGGGNYLGIERSLNIPETSEIRFAFRAVGARRGYIRIQDATGQEHLGGFPIPDPEWQDVRLPLAAPQFNNHWGGAKDGQFHFPLKQILIGVNRSGKGSFSLRDLRILTADASLRWQLSAGTSFPGNIVYVEDGAAPLQIRAMNCLSHPVAAELRCRVVSYYGKEILARAQRLSFDRWQDHLWKVQLPRLHPGFYQVEAEIRAAGQTVAQYMGGLGVVYRPRNLGRDDEQAFFGLHANQPAAAARIGVRWTREWRTWWWGESTPGNYYWPDRAIDEARANHIKVMLVIDGGPPAWARDLVPEGQPVWPFPDKLQQAYGEYVRAVARRYRDKVDVFEIQNEPDLTCWRHEDLNLEDGIESYVRLARAAAPILRAEAPRCRIAGVDVSGGDYDSGLPYSRAVLAKIGNLFDIYTGHPYASPRYFGEGLRPLFPHENRLAEKLEMARALIAAQGGRQRLWIGEKGWGLDVKEPALGLQSRSYAACVAQALITARAAPGVERFFWFLQQGCNENGYEYGLWRGAPSQPLPAAVAYATTARFLEHAKPHRALKLAESLRGYSFACPEQGRGVVALWVVADSMKLSLAYPQGTQAWELMGDSRALKPLLLERAPVFLTVPLARLEALCAALEHTPTAAASPVRLDTLFISARNSLTARVTNRQRRPAAVMLRACGQSVTATLPAGNRPAEVTLPLKEELFPYSGKAIDAVLLANGKPLAARRMKVELRPCPRQTPRLDAPAAEWGKPQFTLDKQGQILPADPNVGWNGPADLSATAWWRYDAENFYLAVRARDDVHSVPAAGSGGFWNSDSLQIGIDPRNDAAESGGYGADDVELGCVLGPDGPHVYQTVPQSRALAIPCVIQRQGDETFYQVAVPWKLLGIEPRAGRVISMNFILNDNDGNGRAYWMGPRPGIGEGKSPFVFLDLHLAQ